MGCSLVVPSLKSCTRTHLTAGSKSLRLKEAVLSSRELCRTFSAELVVPLSSSSTMNSRLCLVKLTKLFVHRIRFSVGSKHLRPQKNTIKTHVRYQLLSCVIKVRKIPSTTSITRSLISIFVHCVFSSKIMFNHKCARTAQ